MNMAQVACSDANLRDIAARASTLWERIAGGYVPRPNDVGMALANARYAQWKTTAAQGSEARFRRRLGWLGLSEGDALALLGEVRLSGSLPSWVAVLADVLTLRSAWDDRSVEQVPFGRLVAPFVSVALKRLPPVCAQVFPESIRTALARDLLRQLSELAATAYYLEFSIFRAQREPPINHFDSHHFDAFCQSLLDARGYPFYLKYPALTRLLSLMTELWVSGTAQFAQALHADRQTLAEFFAGGRRLGPVVDLQVALSDRHEGGRTVALVVFECGLRVVYKPRDVGIEVAWFELLAWLNTLGSDLAVLRVLPRDGYGWVEAVVHKPCASHRQGYDFYRRSGQLLCCLYALEAYDCFCENWIASGSQPVLIDMEALMHQQLAHARDRSAAEVAQDILADSVLRVGLLPAWEVGHDGTCFDMSGLGAQPGQKTPYRRVRWQHPNRDAMQLTHEAVIVEARRHLPNTESRAWQPADYCEAHIGGFQAMYQTLLTQRDVLLAENGPIARFKNQKLRFVFHATRVYSLLLKKLKVPRYLRSGVDRSIRMDLLSRLYLDTPQRAGFEQVLAAELQALEGLDIPRLAVNSSGSNLCLPDGEVVNAAFRQPAYDLIRHRIGSLSAADQALQSSLIRGALQVSETLAVHESALQTAANGEGARLPALTAQACIDEARRIGALIEKQTIHASDGQATWIAPQPLANSPRYALQPMRFDLYGGLAGVAIFFAALQKICGFGAELALRALAPLRRALCATGSGSTTSAGYSSGGGTGLGSMIYSLSLCGDLLGEPGLAKDAGRLCRIDISKMPNIADALDGLAGLVLGLLAHHRITGDIDVLVRATAAGDRLLAMGERTGSGLAWRIGHRRPMTGLSHGAAGIALALLRLAQRSEQRRFLDAAEAAIAFEDSHFDITHENWRDLRHESAAEPIFANSWCHGATGIGLARMAGWPMLASATVKHDIRRAVQHTARAPLAAKDGVCCGNFGRADLLLSAELQHGSLVTKGVAAQMAARIVDRAKQAGGYRLSGRAGTDTFDPSFFQGLSGIGYQLLRLAKPHNLPSVLVWQ